MFAKPTLGKGGGGSVEATQRAAHDANEIQGGRRYGNEETFGVVETLENSGALPETVEMTKAELEGETVRAYEAREEARQKVLDSFSSEEQALDRLAEADARYEKSREREDKKYAAMPNGAEARRANQSAKVARFARDRATDAKRILAKKRKSMTPKQYRAAKRAIKAAREAAKAAKKAAHEAKYAARNGTREQAKAAAERAERVAAEAVAAAVKAEKEARKSQTDEEADNEQPPTAGENPQDTGSNDSEEASNSRSKCEEKDCGTCDPLCDADQECVCKWEEDVASPPSAGEGETEPDGVKGRGVDGRGVAGPVNPESTRGLTPVERVSTGEVSPIESLIAEIEASETAKLNSKQAAVLRRLVRALRALGRRDENFDRRLRDLQKRVDRLLEKGRSSGPLSGSDKYQLQESLKALMAVTAAKELIGELAGNVTTLMRGGHSADKKERAQLERELGKILSQGDNALENGRRAVRSLMDALRHGGLDSAMRAFPSLEDPARVMLERMALRFQEVPDFRSALVEGGLKTMDELLRVFGIDQRILGALHLQSTDLETWEKRIDYEGEMDSVESPESTGGERPDDGNSEEAGQKQEWLTDSSGETWEQEHAETTARGELAAMAQAALDEMNARIAGHSTELELVLEDTSPIVQVIDLDQWEAQQLEAWRTWYFGLPHMAQVRVLSGMLNSSRAEMARATLDYAEMIGVESVKSYLGGVALKYGIAALSKAYKAIAVTEAGAAGTKVIEEIAKGSSKELMGFAKNAFPGKNIEVSAFRFEGLPPIKGRVGGKALQALSSEAEAKVVDLIRSSGRRADVAKVAIRAEDSGQIVKTSIDAVAKGGSGEAVAVEVKRLSAFMEGLGMTKNQLKAYPKLVEGVAEAYGQKARKVGLFGTSSRTLELYIVKKDMIWRVTIAPPIL